MTEKDNSEPVMDMESKTELSNPLDPESALVMKVPRTRTKPFCEDLSKRDHCTNSCAPSADWRQAQKHLEPLIALSECKSVLPKIHIPCYEFHEHQRVLQCGFSEL